FDSDEPRARAVGTSAVFAGAGPNFKRDATAVSGDFSSIAHSRDDRQEPFFSSWVFGPTGTRTRVLRSSCVQGMADSSLDSYPRLLSLAVHEFRTPASVVGGYLRMLQRDTDAQLSERQRKMIDEAERSCARLVAIVAEMSDIAKLDAGVITLTRQPLE